MSTNLILRGFIVPIFYIGAGFLGAIFYDKYKNDTQETISKKEEFNNINNFNNLDDNTKE